MTAYKYMQITGLKIFLAVVVLAVLAAIGGGLYLIGSPGKARDLNFDRQRLSHLQQIANQLDNYASINKRMPESLEELKKSRNAFVDSIGDPETQAPYEFAKFTGTTYELCATFTYNSEDAKDGPRHYSPYGYGESDFWNHEAGRKCYQLSTNRTDERYPKSKTTF